VRLIEVYIKSKYLLLELKAYPVLLKR